MEKVNLIQRCRVIRATAWKFVSTSVICGITVNVCAGDFNRATNGGARVILIRTAPPVLNVQTQSISGWPDIYNTLTNPISPLRYCDTVILVAPSTRFSAADRTVLAPIVADCNAAKCQLYYANAVTSGLAFSSIVLVHVVTPYDNPRDMDNTLCFIGDQFVGRGRPAMVQILDKIDREKPPGVSFVLSGYDDGEWSNTENPFVESLNLYSVVEAKGVKVIFFQKHLFSFWKSEVRH